MRLKHDGFSSLASAEWKAMLDGLLCEDQTSSPYQHEQIQMEQTWHHDVPMTLAMIKASSPNSSEADFYTAFLTHEMCDNVLVRYDGSPCAFQKYYGYCTIDPRAFLVYSAQGHYLNDPEKRGAKFEDHATAGVYEPRTIARQPVRDRVPDVEWREARDC